MGKFKFNQPPAVVLGLGSNGLATVRALGRKGIPVIGIDSDLSQPSAHTRYCSKVYSNGFKKGSNELLESLLRIGQELNMRGVLFPSGDLSLVIVSENRESLEKYYQFALPDKEVVRLILDKKRFCQFSLKEGFPIPKTYFPNGIDEAKQIAREIPYPCIIKPFQPNASWRQKFDIKLFEARSPQELIHHYERIFPVHQDIILQECITGADSELSFSLTYLNSKSEPLAMFTGRKLRQFPPRFGTSSMAESKWDPWIASQTSAILKSLGYKGYGSIEFKRDGKDGGYKIIEVTGRTWFPHGLSTRCGINLPYIAYRDILGMEVEKPDSFEEEVKWIHEERDLKSAYQYWKMGKLTLLTWLTSYRGKRTYSLSAWDDPAPLYYLITKYLFGSFRRLGRVFKR